MEKVLFDFISKYMPLSAKEKQIIIDLSLFKTFKKGAILVKEGQVSNESYFILNGCLRSYYIVEGEEKTTAFYIELESLSPICTINKQASEYYINCVEDSILLVSNQKMEQIVFEKFPRFETLCRILSEELLAKNQLSFDDFKTSSPEQRYLKMVKTRPDLLQRVPQHQIASYLGITPQSLSRMRQRLSKKGQANCAS